MEPSLLMPPPSAPLESPLISPPVMVGMFPVGLLKIPPPAPPPRYPGRIQPPPA